MKKTLPLALLTLASCSAHRQTIDLTHQKTEIADSLVFSSSSQLLDTRFSALAATADSAAVSITADSLVTPAGARIYRPRLSATAHAPRLTRADTIHTSMTADTGFRQTLSHLSDTAISHDKTSEAKSSPLSPLKAIAIVVLFALMVRYLYRLCQPRHSDL